MAGDGEGATALFETKVVGAASKEDARTLAKSVICSSLTKAAIFAYCSILGLLCACPLSPVSQFVIESAGKINFTAPLTMVGAFAGMSISNQLKMFFKQGWKLIIITVLVMTGTFFGSLAEPCLQSPR